MEQPITISQNESIEITKNSKGYGWVIKILSTDTDRIFKLNEELKKKFNNEIILKGGVE